MKPKDRPHYVNNKDFSAAVHDYCAKVKAVKEANEKKGDGELLEPIPQIPNYIGQCFLKISEGLSHKHNFVRYTYREEMVMDAVENCIRAINNYDIDKATRTGNPNAFSYFTQIAYFAFLRRIEKEKKTQDIKWKYIERAGLEQFVHYEDHDIGEMHVSEQAFVDMLKERIDRVKDTDRAVKEFKKKEEAAAKRNKKKEGGDGLEYFFGGA